jgi:hypothetical protein
MRCPSCRMIVSQYAVSCPECGRLLVAPERVVEGTVVASSVSASAPIYDAEATTTSAAGARPNRLTRQRPRSTVISSLARFAQDAWNEPVVRVAASAALIALGERLADRFAGTGRGRRTSAREYAPPPSQRQDHDATQNVGKERSLVPYAHPGELADRGYVGNMIETIIVIRRTLRRR